MVVWLLNKTDSYEMWQQLKCKNGKKKGNSSNGSIISTDTALMHRWHRCAVNTYQILINSSAYRQLCNHGEAWIPDSFYLNAVLKCFIGQRSIFLKEASEISGSKIRLIQNIIYSWLLYLFLGLQFFLDHENKACWSNSWVMYLVFCFYFLFKG